MREFSEQFAMKVEEFENYLAASFKQLDYIPEPLYSAMEYGVKSGGKRLRPVLALASGEMLGLKREEILPLCEVLELIHSYSLVHDDLPCMDNDDFRRGKPTCHRVYGEGMAMLAGDGLLNLAYEVGLRAITESKEPLLMARAVKFIADAAGANGMIKGQCFDLKYEGMHDLSEKDLIDVHENKTSKLIEASLIAPAYLAGADENAVNYLYEYAKNVGLVFQITDDILDIEGDSNEFGKPIGSDLKSDKLTFPKIYGMEKSKELCVLYIERAKEAIKNFGKKSEFLLQFANFILKRKK